MKSLSDHCRFAMFSCLMAISFLITFKSELAAQPPNVQAFANETLAAELALNEFQESQRKRIQFEYVSRMMDELETIPNHQKTIWLKELKQRYNDEYEELLNDDQKKVLKQYYFWASVANSSQPLNLWSNEKVIELLGLTGKQKSKLKELAEDLKAAIEKIYKEHAQKLEQANKELESSAKKILLPFQTSLIKDHLGDDFDFKETKLYQQLMHVAQIFQAVKEAEKVSTTIEIDYRSALLALGTSGDLDSQPRFEVLVAFANDKDVAKDIELTDAQKQQLGDYHSIITKYFDTLKSMPGLDGNADTRDLLEGLDNPKIPHEPEKRIQLLEKCLKQKQIQRLIQIRNQFIVKSRSPEQIVWFHEGWVAFLQMTDAQKSELNSLKRDHFEKKKKLGEKLLTDIKKIQSESVEAALQVLTMEQQSIWRAKTGAFGGIK
jgi:hypothetical protein